VFCGFGLSKDANRTGTILLSDLTGQVVGAILCVEPGNVADLGVFDRHAARGFFGVLHPLLASGTVQPLPPVPGTEGTRRRSLQLRSAETGSHLSSMIRAAHCLH